MKTYQSLVDALADLKERGYDHDFNLDETHLIVAHLSLKLSPNEFHIREFYRFEGMTNPSDSSILYAIESNNGIKGVLVNAYGVYADTMSNEMIEKLNTH